MKPIIAKVQESQLRKDHPAFRPGDTIRVNVRLKEGEGDKERIQPFEGVVMSRRGELLGESFTVRRVSFGIGVERIFPVHSPMISSIEVVRQGSVRRAKLNYLRGRKGKAARIKRVERVGGRGCPRLQRRNNGRAVSAHSSARFENFEAGFFYFVTRYFDRRRRKSLTSGYAPRTQCAKIPADGTALLYSIRARSAPARLAAHRRA